MRWWGWGKGVGERDHHFHPGSGASEATFREGFGPRKHQAAGFPAVPGLLSPGTPRHPEGPWSLGSTGGTGATGPFPGRVCRLTATLTFAQFIPFLFYAVLIDVEYSLTLRGVPSPSPGGRS